MKKIQKLDIFQERYLQHQQSKAKNGNDYDNERKEYPTEAVAHLKEIIVNRRSQRIFNDKEVKNLDLIRFSAKHAPTSCNRQAISIEIVEGEAIKKTGNELVGGRGWMKNAKLVLLFKANMEAYKSPAEVHFMKYLDTGHISQNIQLMCEVLGLGCCFVNPNGRDDICGALAIGHYDKKAPIKTKENL